MLKRIGVLSGMLLLLGACGGSGGGGSSVNGAVNSYNDSAKKAVEAQCECVGEDQGYTSTEECVAAGYEEQELSDCEVQAARCDSSTFRAKLGCDAAAADDFAACLSSCTDTAGGDAGQADAGWSGPDDPAAIYQACQSEYVDALDACRMNNTSETLLEAFSECSQGAASPSCSSADGANSTPNNSTSNNTPGDIDQAFNSYVDSLETYLNGLCACDWSEFGYESEQQCREEIGSSIGGMDSCQRGVAEADSTAFISYIGCYTRMMDDLGTCMSSCPSEAQRQVCQDNSETAIANCDDQHPEMSAGIEGCNN